MFINGRSDLMRAKIRKAARYAAAVILTVAMILPLSAVDTHAEIFYLQTYRRLDTDFYANYYPDLKAKYGYDPHKLLDHYINYGIFERRIPAPEYLYNMDALVIGDLVPEGVLYMRKSLRKGLTQHQFHNAYVIARDKIVNPTRSRYPNSMLLQMNEIASRMYNWINFAPGVRYRTDVRHYNDPTGVFGVYKSDGNGKGGFTVSYAASSAGATRAVGLCLNMLAIPYQHVNENTWKQQFVKVNINGMNYIIDPYVAPRVMSEVEYVMQYPPYKN